MFVDFNILNQLGSPSINSNTFANRPAAGQIGRLFVSTDTFEIYRDNGTTWDLIGGPGSSTITGTGTATQVAYFTSSQAIGSSSNLFWDNTNIRLGIGTSTPGVRLDIHGTGNMLHINSTSATANALMSFQRTGTNVWRIGDQYNGGNNYFELHNTALANNAIQIDAATNKSIFTSIENYVSGLARANYFDYTLNLPNGTTISSPNAVTTLGATLNLNIAGSATLPNGARSGMDVFNGVNFTSAGTFTINQSSTIRAFSNLTSGWAFNGSAVGTITHLAGLRILFPTNSGSAINVTDNYALLINNQNANTGTITYTNRWGIYQEGASDLNYMAANLLLGSTVNNGNKLQVTGNSNISGNLDIGGTGGTKNLNVFGDARLLNSQPTLDFTLNINTAFSHSIVGSNYSTSPLSSNTLEFRVANGANTQATVMTLNGAGNVGIGTTSPNNFLELSNLSATGALRFSTSANTAFYWDIGRDNVSTGDFLFRKANGGAAVDIMRIDNNGNLGLGVTPSAGLATANYRLFQIGLDGAGSIYSGSNQTLIGTNINWVGGTPNYAITGYAPTLYNQQNGAHSWNTAPSGTAGNAITFTQPMTLDASGNLGINQTPNASYGKLQIKTPASAYTLDLIGRTAGVNAESSIYFWNSAQTSMLAAIGNVGSNLEFYTNGAGPYMRIATSGNVLIGTTTDAGYKLDVNGTARFSNDITIQSTQSDVNIDSTSTTQFSRIRFYENSVATGGIQYINSAFVTTSRRDKLEVFNGSGIHFVSQGNFNTPDLILASTGAATFSSSITTGTPSGGTAAAWKLGSRVAATVVVNTTEYIEVDIGGTLYKLATVT